MVFKCQPENCKNSNSNWSPNFALIHGLIKFEKFHYINFHYSKFKVMLREWFLFENASLHCKYESSPHGGELGV